MLNNFTSMPHSFRSKQNRSLGARPPSIPQHVWQHSQEWECGSRNSTLRAESSRRQYIGKQIPVSRAKLLEILVGKTHIWSCMESAQIAVDKEERKEGLEGKWKERFLHVSLSFPSACVMLLWAIKQLQCSAPEGVVSQWRWRMTTAAKGFGSPLEWKRW